jgi:DNA-binding NarL/FixJ family response regulator
VSLRILLADDHRLFAEGLAALLEREPGLEVVGTARDGREAVKAALALAPDVVAMDVSMPGLSGIEATRQIAAGRPEIKILCLSMHRERQYLQAALEAGASGYVLKDDAPEMVIAAIRRVAGGGIYLCPEMTAAAVSEYRTSLVDHKAAIDPVLTPREREVLQLVAEGWTSQEIAARLCVSERTVATHRQHLTEKLDIKSVAGLTKYAIRQGLTTAERDRRTPQSLQRKIDHSADCRGASGRG